MIIIIMINITTSPFLIIVIINHHYLLVFVSPMFVSPCSSLPINWAGIVYRHSKGISRFLEVPDL